MTHEGTNARSKLICLAVAATWICLRLPAQEWRSLSGAEMAGERQKPVVAGLMEKHGVSALSLAVVQDGRIAFLFQAGRVDAASGKAVDGETVFRGASLSKPVFAYLALRLADEGLIDLDRPIGAILGKPLGTVEGYQDLGGDPRQQRLTPRLLLSHQGGFPNWRRMTGGKLLFQFSPGERFGYSGEGYRLLQQVLETLTGKALPELAREKVFAPLGMERSSYLWESRFDGNFAVELGTGLGPLIERSRRISNCAGSLATRAGDYARFLLAALSGEGLKAETRKAMFSPQVEITSESAPGAPSGDGGRNKAIGLSWALGWGRFRSPAGEAAFHIGQEDGCENYAVLFPERRTGLVLLTVCRDGSGIAAALARELIGDVYSPFAWMGY